MHLSLKNPRSFLEIHVYFHDVIQPTLACHKFHLPMRQILYLPQDQCEWKARHQRGPEQYVVVYSPTYLQRTDQNS